MGNFNDRRPSGNRSFGRRDFGGSRGGGGRGFDRGGDRGGDRPMYPAMCSECGKACNLPFRPTNGKPVYCSDCFENVRGNDSRQDFPRPERSDFKAPSVDNNKHQFEALNQKLDKIVKLLETKISQSPVVKEAIKVLESKDEPKEAKIKKTVKKATPAKKK